MEYEITEQDKQLLKQADDLMKRDLGGVDIEGMICDESEKFDRRKFGKLKCPFCSHEFNPFYLNKFKFEGEWEWVWRWEYKEPEKKYECNCPKCKEELFFRTYIGQ